ncbi:MAG: DNA polymerase I [Lachnospiraceae bacterium]|nr:DNA polymerase I [Lachnospiraceae bacterium]
MSDRKKLVLIDGHSILNRAFYGIPDLTNGEGLHTNAIYGFLNIMFKIVEEENPEYLAVAFDVSAPTFRHQMYSEYKGTRKGMPEELKEQVPVMKEVLKAMGILIMEKPGLEADDILGTFAKRAQGAGLEVALVSGDRDLLQIADEHIKIRIPKTKGGKTEVEDYYAKDVLEAYQVTPLQFIELKALMGDTSDNIPGVPKIGPKTATDLMVKYGSIESIYENLEQITKKSVKETLQNNRHLADLSKTLATIEINGDIPFTLEDAVYRDPFTKEAYGYFKKLELKNLLKRFDASVAQSQTEKRNFQYVREWTEGEKIFEKLSHTNRVGIRFIREEKGRKCIALSLTIGPEETYVLVPEDFLSEQYIIDKISSIYGEKEILTIGVKEQYSFFQAKEAKQIKDVLLQAYLCNPLKNDYDEVSIAGEHLDMVVAGRSEYFGKLSLEQALEEKPEQFLEYAGFLSYIPYMAEPVLTEKLQQMEMEKLFLEIEMPLTYVLYAMEREGILVQAEALKAYGENLVDQISALEQSIYDQAGTTFNINSPKQLGEVLFEKMGIPGGKKTKTGYSTAAEVLEKLAEEYPIVTDILQYRGLTKLKSTYADGLFDCIAEDGRIHTTFNQTITATGRISSTEPNLQNIPIRMEQGRLIRKVFVPKEGCVFVDADYSQIELRLLAHMSKDTELIEAYASEADIHRMTASKVFHIPFDEVTDLQRRNAKAVNFGIVYGISSFGLSQDLSITRKEAAAYIEQYFATYPQVKAFLDGLVSSAKADGFVSTLYGRRRPIPELSSGNFMQRSFGERVAMNAPLQGTAADIMKLAMIHVFEKMKEQGLQAKILLQVHDELLIEAPLEEVEQVKTILEEEMKGVAKLSVALEIDVHTGKDWYEAK